MNSHHDISRGPSFLRGGALVLALTALLAGCANTGSRTVIDPPAPPAGLPDPPPVSVPNPPGVK